MRAPDNYIRGNSLQGAPKEWVWSITEYLSGSCSYVGGARNTLASACIRPAGSTARDSIERARYATSWASLTGSWWDIYCLYRTINTFCVGENKDVGCLNPKVLQVFPSYHWVTLAWRWYSTMVRLTESARLITRFGAWVMQLVVKREAVDECSRAGWRWRSL